MSSIQGKIGPWKLTWDKIPQGESGFASVKLERDGKEPETRAVHWKRDGSGLWLEWEGGVFGFDLEGTRDEEKKLFFRARERGRSREWEDLRFVRDTEAAVDGTSKKKKNLAIKAQMPGKVVKLLVEEGAKVEKGQPLLVLEAMKMENEIRALHAGVVLKIFVASGSTVESGAVLLQVGEES